MIHKKIEFLTCDVKALCRHIDYPKLLSRSEMLIFSRQHLIIIQRVTTFDIAVKRA